PAPRPTTMPDSTNSTARAAASCFWRSSCSTFWEGVGAVISWSSRSVGSAAGLLENVDPLAVPPGNLVGGLRGRDLLVAPGHQGLPEAGAAHGEADEARHGGRRAEPLDDLRLVLAPAEDDAANLAPSV